MKKSYPLTKRAWVNHFFNYLLGFLKSGKMAALMFCYHPTALSTLKDDISGDSTTLRWSRLKLLKRQEETSTKILARKRTTETHWQKCQQETVTLAESDHNEYNELLMCANIYLHKSLPSEIGTKKSTGYKFYIHLVQSSFLWIDLSIKVHVGQENSENSKQYQGKIFNNKSQGIKIIEDSSYCN